MLYVLVYVSMVAGCELCRHVIGTCTIQFLRRESNSPRDAGMTCSIGIVK